jgi:hypothetical protein
MNKHLNRAALRSAVCLLVVTGIMTTGSVAAFAAAPATGSGGSTRALSDSDPTVCTTGYDESALSLDVSMYNATDEPLTLDPALTGHNGTGEHWNHQPPAVILPGQCADMNAYSSDGASGFAVFATYTTPKGDFVPFTASIFGNADYNSSVFSAAPSFSDHTYTWSGQQDPAYNIDGAVTAGRAHRHVTEKFEGGKTDSYPLTTAPIVINAGGSTATWQASCALGYHVRLDATTNKPIVTFATVTGSTSGFSIKSSSLTDADGSVDGSTQYRGFTYSLQNTSSANGTGTMTWTCDPSVYAAQAPTFLHDTPAAAVNVSTPVAYRFSALGFPAPTFGVKSGSLPTGLSLDLNGDLTGKPTMPGTYTFTVTATNAAGSAMTPQITIVVS